MSEHRLLDDERLTEAGLFTVACREFFTERQELPVCPVCGVRAWPGDESKHIFSRHLAAEMAS